MTTSNTTNQDCTHVALEVLHNQTQPTFISSQVAISYKHYSHLSPDKLMF